MEKTDMRQGERDSQNSAKVKGRCTKLLTPLEIRKIKIKNVLDNKEIC